MKHLWQVKTEHFIMPQDEFIFLSPPVIAFWRTESYVEIYSIALLKGRNKQYPIMLLTKVYTDEGVMQFI